MSNSERNQEQENEDNINYKYLPFVIAVFIILFILSFGRINPLVDEKNRERKKQESLKSRHKKMKQFIHDKKALSQFLAEQTKENIKSVRLSIICIYLIINAVVLMFINFKFEILLMWNGVFFSFFSIVTLWQYGHVKGFITYLKKIEMYVELRTYGKYKDIDVQIKKHKKEKKKISQEIVESQNKIDNLN